jgi:hypothetical protein
MTTDIEEQILRDILLAAYHDIVPEHSSLGERLMLRLAAGLYQRGARVQISDPPPKFETIHISVDSTDLIVWTCKEFHAALGYRPHGLINKHIDKILTPDSAAYRKDFGIPALLRDGKCGPIVTSFVTAAGTIFTGSLMATVLRHSNGDFARTFSRIKFIPMAGLGYLLSLFG